MCVYLCRSSRDVRAADPGGELLSPDKAGQNLVLEAVAQLAAGQPLNHGPAVHPASPVIADPSVW